MRDDTAKKVVWPPGLASAAAGPALIICLRASRIFFVSGPEIQLASETMLQRLICLSLSLHTQTALYCTEITKRL